MERVEKPAEDDVHLFTGNIEPLIPGSKWVFEAEHLKIGYDRPLLEITCGSGEGRSLVFWGQMEPEKVPF